MPRARFTADRRYTASIDFIQRTLRTWLDFPKNSSYVRSLFIRAIISAFGCSDVLLLDGVWDVYQRAESSLLILDDPPQLTLQPSDSAAPGLEALHRFVMDCYGLLDHLLDGKQITQTRLQNWCLRNEDKYLPFRELARGCRAVTSLQGPFHPTNIDKPGGIASAFIFRCITFGAEASYHSPTFFATLEDFVALRNAHPSDYICNKNAYGSHAVGRDASHGEAMFAAAPHFVEFFSDHPNVPFLDARKDTRKLLPGCGPLTATLLASDFVYAGKVKMPTVPEMGHVVASLKLGARAGLIRLGLLSGVSATEGEVCTAFVLAYNHLEAKLPAAVKSRMNFDVIMLEHALCKLKRSGTYFKV
ncbi:uncharacterized protein C8Q71DRAFT_706298 [Rhodofomes roseus]|uniref:Uncharacterized protein n=1 Tax=Rhodofomes roseus TaxID=34475 RepID=A0ABQ8KJ15_9APHY|nr:uncharacterized protein C8Q71DRAFT_706298 [Rhodofomes roseus]KAH9837948.1 hypothetical protein C8Q71DRAFT_706298 [Rhodofomes roseus]